MYGCVKSIYALGHSCITIYNNIFQSILVNRDLILVTLHKNNASVCMRGRIVTPCSFFFYRVLPVLFTAPYFLTL
jgi:hypothetical protein